MESPTEDRQRLLNGLDRMEQALTSFYRALLWLIIVGVVAVVALVIVNRPWGDGHQGEWFYFAIGVMLVLGWAVGQFLWLGRRASRRRKPWGIHSQRSPGVFKWEFRFSSSADDPHTHPSNIAGRFESAPLDEQSPNS